MTTEQTRRIAIALSGGGSRAIAFHLGCLRGLKKANLLDQTVTISAVSGGSVIAALYCSHHGNFDEFERKVRATLAEGFVRPSIRVALTSPEGLRAIICFIATVLDRGAASLLSLLLRALPVSRRPTWGWLKASSFRRFASRTTILRKTFSTLFGHASLGTLRPDRPHLIVIGCELRAKAAIYFTKHKIHCWRYGSCDADNVPISQAVAASASYPVLLPALDESIEFERKGVRTKHRVSITDGGVYDNLGLGPFWPGRNPEISMTVPHFDHIISCQAGYSLTISPPPGMWISRMRASFESVFARAQNIATNRLFFLKETEQISGILVPYLGQDDNKLSCPPAGLVNRTSVENYPTDFFAMKAEWVDRLSIRGEQLVSALLREHWNTPPSAQ